MKQIQILLIGVFTIVLSSWVSSQDDLKTILKQADFYRGGQISGIYWDLTVENIEEGKQKNLLNLKIEASSTNSEQFALITFLKPKKYLGQKLLLRNNSMWFVKRGMRRPIPISGRQRLTGSAANADVASANYYQDYNIIGATDAILNDIPCLLFELEAKSTLINYSKLKYWISKEGNKGLKAEFYGKSGKLIKTGIFEYNNTIDVDGKTHPFISKIVISNKINTQDKTILSIEKPVIKSLSNATFQKNSLLD